MLLSDGRRWCGVGKVWKLRELVGQAKAAVFSAETLRHQIRHACICVRLGANSKLLAKKIRTLNLDGLLLAHHHSTLYRLPRTPHTTQHGRRSLRRCHWHRSWYAMRMRRLRETPTYTAQARPTRVSPIMRAPASRSVSATSILDAEWSLILGLCSRQRAGKLHDPVLRFLHLRGAPHWRSREEPGRHEPGQHRFRRQVSGCNGKKRWFRSI